MTPVMLFVLIAGLAAGLGLYRLLAGPTRTDRVVGLDILFAAAVVFSLLAAWASARTVYLDVAIGLALVGFAARRRAKTPGGGVTHRVTQMPGATAPRPPPPPALRP